jgi:Transposase
MRRPSAPAPPTPRSALTRFTWCASPNAPSIRSAATSGTPTTAHTPRPASGSRTPRWSLLKSPEKQTIRQLALLGEVQNANKPMFRAFLLNEELRLLYQLEDAALAPAHLDAWLSWASRSRLQPFVKLARTISPPPRRHPRRDPPRPLKRPPRRPQQPHPPHQPPQLRLPQRRPAHRPRLPLLRRDRHHAPTMTFTTKPIGAPQIVGVAEHVNMPATRPVVGGRCRARSQGLEGYF